MTLQQDILGYSPFCEWSGEGKTKECIESLMKKVKGKHSLLEVEIIKRTERTKYAIKGKPNRSIRTCESLSLRYRPVPVIMAL